MARSRCCGCALILLKSSHRGNTGKLADVLGADIRPPDEVSPEEFADYDLLDFGSGIYFGRLHAELRAWLRRLPRTTTPQPAFVFSTAGLPFLRSLWHWPVKRALAQRGYAVLGDFCCRGHDSVGPLRLIGGLNRGHPNAADIERARRFASDLRQRALTFVTSSTPDRDDHAGIP